MCIKNTKSLKCEYCGKQHDGSFANGRFCSLTCSKKFATWLALQNTPVSKRHELYRNIARYRYKNATKTGKFAESAVINKFMEYDVGIYLPEINIGVDLLIRIGSSFVPIQVIGSSNISGKYNNIISFSLTKHISKSIDNNGNVVRFSCGYPEDKIHYFALYDIVNKEVYLVKNKNINKHIALHKSIPEDNNNPLYKYCDTYKFDNVINKMIYDYTITTVEYKGDLIYVEI